MSTSPYPFLSPLLPSTLPLAIHYHTLLQTPHISYTLPHTFHTPNNPHISLTLQTQNPIIITANKLLCIIAENGKYASILQYANEEMIMRTVSMHMLQNEEEIEMEIPTGGEGRIGGGQAKVQAEIEPMKRCIVVLGEKGWNKIMLDGPKPYTTRHPLSSLSPRIKHVRHMKFLNEYHAPTLAILFEAERTSASRLAFMRDTVALEVISMDTDTNTNTSIGFIDKLPFDCHSILSLSSGMLVIGINHILHIHQNARVTVLAINDGTKGTTNHAIAQYLHLDITLEDAKFDLISEDRVLFVLASGEMYCLKFSREAAHNSKFSFTYCGQTVMPSQMLSLPDDIVVISSKSGDIVHLKYYGNSFDADPATEAEPNEAPDGNNLLQNARGIDIRFSLEKHHSQIGSLNCLTVGQKKPGEFEFVGCTGHGRHGAIARLQHSILPKITASYEMPNAVSIHRAGQYLLVTRSHSSMLGYYTVVLDSAKGLRRTNQTPFHTKWKTITAAMIGNIYVQVTQETIRLFQGTTVEDFPLSNVIANAFICSTYVLCKNVDSSVTVLQVTPNLQVTLIEESGNIDLSNITSCALFEDPFALFDDDDLPDMSSTRTSSSNTTAAVSWLIITRGTGELQIYRLPDMQLLFSQPLACMEPHVLRHSDQAESNASGIILPMIQEIFLTYVDSKGNAVVKHNSVASPTNLFLFIRTDDNRTVIYQAYTGAKLPTGMISTRFRKISHPHIATAITSGDRRSHSFHPFQCIRNQRGVFVSGDRPFFFTAPSQQTSRIHPLRVKAEDISKEPDLNNNISAKVQSFASVQTDNVQNECYAIIDDKGTLSICELVEDEEMLDSDILIKKESVGDTPHQILHHAETQTYVLTTSFDEPFDLFEAAHYDIELEGKEEENLRQRWQKFNTEQPKALSERFNMHLISPVTWKPIDSFEFDAYESILAIENVSLDTKSNTSGRKNFLAVGTAFIRGEDLQVKGRIRIFDVMSVVSDPDHPEMEFKFKLIHTEEIRNPCTAMCDVNGHLLACLGNKLLVYSFEDNQTLLPTAFLDLNVYATCVKSIKNFVIVGDYKKSVNFLAFQEEPPKLEKLGADYIANSITSCNIMLQSNYMFMIVTDLDQHLHILSYAPAMLQSLNGQRLIHCGKYNLDSTVACQIRINQSPRISVHKNKESSGVILTSTDGSLQYLGPLPEPSYKRLLSLYNRLVSYVSHPGGFNPKAYRFVRPKVATASSLKMPLDVHILHLYSFLTYNKRKELANSIGTTTARIAEDLQLIENPLPWV